MEDYFQKTAKELNLGLPQNKSERELHQDIHCKSLVCWPLGQNVTAVLHDKKGSERQ